jgi:ribosomal protein S12 methylthiotransferase accessory factor
MDTNDPSFTVALGLGAKAFVRALLEVEKSLGQAIVTLDLSNLKTERHSLRKRAQCSYCGDDSLFEKQVAAPVFINPSPVVYDLEGGVRNTDPLTTWNIYRHLVDPITGVVAHLGPYEGKNHPLRPVYYGTYFVHPPPAQVTEEERFTRNSYGKGVTPMQARVSALCEAVERYSAMYQGDEPILRGTYDALAPAAVHPEVLCNFSDAQYADKSLATIACSRQVVPPRYRNDQPIDWSPAWSLSRETKRLLPACYCYTNYPSPKEERVCLQNSNGHAAGNSIEEAILQGVFELVERDAAAVWWYNRLRFPMVSIESFYDTYFENVTKHYSGLGWDIWCLDITTDLNIPVVVAVARHRQSKDYCVGMGCHLSGKLAIQRALTEIHQVFDPLGEQPPVWNESDIVDPRFLVPDFDLPAVDADTLGGYRSASLSDYIAHCLDTLAKAGLELIVQNQTRPDVGLCCIKTVVPGLRHMWRRLGPGRLYDVPVRMKWLETPLKEEALNPKPLLL